MKQIVLLSFFVLLSNIIFSQKANSNDENSLEILKKEEMPLFDGAKNSNESNQQIFIYFYKKAKKSKRSIKMEGTKTVYASFIVDTLGKAVRPKIMQSQGEQLDNLVLKYIRQMPKWIPGRKNGEKSEVEYTVPIKFRE
jgi:protein TonB